MTDRFRRFLGVAWALLAPTEVWASSTAHRRYIEPVKTRSRCWCGCKQRATHHGMARGVALTRPLCEFAARRWVRDGRLRVPRTFPALTASTKDKE